MSRRFEAQGPASGIRLGPSPASTRIAQADRRCRFFCMTKQRCPDPAGTLLAASAPRGSEHRAADRHGRGGRKLMLTDMMTGDRARRAALLFGAALACGAA